MNPYIGIPRDEYMAANARLVYSVVYDKFTGMIRSNHFDQDDMHQLGMIGLMKAYDKYDPTKFNGKVTKFSTYAIPLIFGEIMNSLRNTDYGPSFPRDVKLISSKMSKTTIKDLHDPLEIAEIFDITKKKAESAILCYHYSLPIYLEDTRFNMLAIDEDNSRIIVEDFISYLSDMDRTIVYLCLKGKSQSAIAEHFGIAQISISRYLKKIRGYYNEYREGNPLDIRIVKE
jgi:RNA polymerase sigma factor (sigma-70 family)